MSGAFPEWLEHPIIITGTGRCGKTLLRTLLDDHPQLIVWPAEISIRDLACQTDWNDILDLPKIRRVFLGKYSTTGGKDTFVNRLNVDIFIEWIHKYAQPASLGPKVIIQNLLQALRAADPVLREIPETEFRGFVLESNVANVNPFDIFPLFPRLRLIYVLRDPIEVFASVKRMEERSRTSKQVINNIRCTTLDCMRYTTWLKQRLFTLFSQLERLIKEKSETCFLSVHYEDLTTCPRKTLIQITNFMGIEFNECMLQSTTLGKVYPGNSSDSRDDYEGVIGPTHHDLSNLSDVERVALEFILVRNVSPAVHYKLQKEYPVCSWWNILSSQRQMFSLIQKFLFSTPFSIRSRLITMAMLGYAFVYYFKSSKLNKYIRKEGYKEIRWLR